MVFKKFFSCVLSVAISLSLLSFQGLDAMDAPVDGFDELSLIESCDEDESSIYLVEGQKESKILSLLRFGLNYNRMDVIVTVLDQFITNVPAFIKDKNDKEAFYHSLVLALLGFVGLDVHSDAPAGDGRADLKVFNQYKSRKYCFEFKFNTVKKEGTQKEHLLEALKQIFVRRYCEQESGSKTPTTPAAIVFFGKDAPCKCEDNFENVSTLAFSLEKRKITTRAFVSSSTGIEKCLGDYDDWEDFCSPENYKDLQITKASLEEISEKDLYDPSLLVQPLQGSRENLETIIDALRLEDKVFGLSLFYEQMRCIVSTMGYLQRLENKEYYLGLLYTTLVCGGFNVSIEGNNFFVKEDDCLLVFHCSFSDYEEPTDVPKFSAGQLAAMFMSSYDDSSVPVYFYNLNINKDPHSSRVDLSPHAVVSHHGIITTLGKKQLPSPRDQQNDFIDDVIKQGAVPMPSTEQKDRVRPREILSNLSPKKNPSPEKKKIKLDLQSGGK